MESLVARGGMYRGMLDQELSSPTVPVFDGVQAA